MHRKSSVPKTQNRSTSSSRISLHWCTGLRLGDCDGFLKKVLSEKEIAVNFDEKKTVKENHSVVHTEIQLCYKRKQSQLLFTKWSSFLWCSIDRILPSSQRGRRLLLLPCTWLWRLVLLPCTWLWRLLLLPCTWLWRLLLPCTWLWCYA